MIFKLIRKAVPWRRGRAVIGLVFGIVGVWIPLIIGIAESATYCNREIREAYQDWSRYMRRVLSIIRNPNEL